MNLSKLEEVPNFKIEDWLIEELNLNSDQKRLLYDEYNGVIRDSPYFFYQFKEIKETNFLWRISIIFLPIYYILALGFSFSKYLIIGDPYLGRKFYKNVHLKWMERIGI